MGAAPDEPLVSNHNLMNYKQLSKLLISQFRACVQSLLVFLTRKASMESVDECVNGVKLLKAFSEAPKYRGFIISFILITQSSLWLRKKENMLVCVRKESYFTRDSFIMVALFFHAEVR